MHFTRAFLTLFALGLLGGAAAAQSRSITQAHYETPVTRYGHFALGPPHEYAQVVAITDTGQRVVWELPENEVFEDLAPRLVRLHADEPTQLLTIVSSREGGARLVLLALRGARLAVSAQSAPVGTPMRWLNPVAVVDLDGDARAEIAAVITPHIGGTLKVYRQQGAQLVEAAALGGFSNHAYGSAQLALSVAMPLAGRMHLLVPDARRQQLRVVALENGRLIEQGRCALAAQVTGAVTVLSATEVAVQHGAGRQVMLVAGCLK
jgi:hypothetical protein